MTTHTPYSRWSTGKTNVSPSIATTYHEDGTVTYWSVYDQQWRRTDRVPARELAAMCAAERDQVIAHCGMDPELTDAVMRLDEWTA